ncbi:hypothetical protein C7C46_08520 [Streptomyces tateyamensis]|uniref:SnoaL-like domain-containing protein n=1 Tax=Streptomyces tateyamensis TaxID=565073 RepID=A0A2V4PFA3_9ACTN|nr:nuclear transport factor 2 family protein [Streptomyces tateyamensis]PYC83781.1 hypothetical protein C7C46_08520 [Streptomyces tateyamensis]
MDSQLYFEIQQFYAHQMQSLDNGEAEAFAETFTLDGSFVHHPHNRVDTRTEIALATKRGVEKTRAAGVVRRHWFGMLAVEAAEDGAVRTRYAALTSATAADGSVSWEPSCLVEDLLVRVDGRLLNHVRTVRRDDVREA